MDLDSQEKISAGLRVGKKDILLKRWLEITMDIDEGQTAYLKTALLSHIRNKPIKIGAINPYLNKNSDDIMKTLTFTEEDGELYTWISEMKKNKKYSSKIKKIISSCIDITENQESIQNYAILLAQLEEGCKIIDNTSYVNIIKATEIPKIEKIFKEDIPVKQSTDTVVYEEKTQKQKSILNFVSQNIVKGK
jgi:hypothetical protein